MKNTLVEILGMSKGGVQSAKLLRNSHWLLDFPSLGFSMASSLALNSPTIMFNFFVFLNFKNEFSKSLMIKI